MPIFSRETSPRLLDRIREPVGHDAEEAWERLVPIYQSLLQKWLRVAGLQPVDRDALSERVLEVLVRRLPKLEHNGRPGAFRAWLRGITVNFLREFWRQKPTPQSSSLLDQLTDPHSELSKLWDEQHDRHVMDSLLELVQMEFTDTTWRAFQRLVLDGIPARDVAAELGITVNAVLIAKSRVLARLRQEAGGWLD